MNNKLIGIFSVCVSILLWIVAAIILPNYNSFKNTEKVSLHGGVLIVVTLLSLSGVVWGCRKFFKKNSN